MPIHFLCSFYFAFLYMDLYLAIYLYYIPRSATAPLHRLGYEKEDRIFLINDSTFFVYQIQEVKLLSTKEGSWLAQLTQVAGSYEYK